MPRTVKIITGSGNKQTALNGNSEESLKVSRNFFNRVAPHNIDAEQALLACSIIEGGQESMAICVENRIQSESFFKPAHRIIYATILELYNEGKPINEIILGERLQSKNNLESVGGLVYLHELTSRIDTPAHLKHYLEIVRDTATLRNLIRTSVQTIEDAYSRPEQVEHFIDKVEQEIFKISEHRYVDHAQSIKDSIDGAIKLVNQLVSGKGEVIGVPSGFRDLDRMTLGFNAQEMIVIAARPAMGKTGIALNMAEAAILPKGKGRKIPTLFFSLEMSAEQLAMRLLCSRARADMSKLKEGVLPAEIYKDITRAAQEIREAPFWIDSSSSLTILELRAKARRMHARHKLGCIIVDYLQLISGTDSRVPREQQIAEISRGLKAMARELNIPVIVLGQLNRESEKERRQPRVSDLRESGSIEQDADMVLLLAKKRDFDEEEEQGMEAVDRELIVAKHRNGPVGVVKLSFIKSLTRFENGPVSYEPRA